MEVFRQLSQSLRSGHIRALVIGGHAVGAVARRRFTNDIDLLIAASAADDLAVLLASCGYRRTAANALVIRHVHADVMEAPVDVLLVNETTFQKLWDESREASIEGHLVRVPSPANLIALKLHAMRQDSRRFAQDAADIAAIVDTHPDELDEATLIALCGRFGGPEMWKRLHPALGSHDR